MELAQSYLGGAWNFLLVGSFEGVLLYSWQRCTIIFLCTIIIIILGEKKKYQFKLLSLPQINNYTWLYCLIYSWSQLWSFRFPVHFALHTSFSSLCYGNLWPSQKQKQGTQLSHREGFNIQLLLGLQMNCLYVWCSYIWMNQNSRQRKRKADRESS